MAKDLSKELASAVDKDFVDDSALGMEEEMDLEQEDVEADDATKSARPREDEDMSTETANKGGLGP